MAKWIKWSALVLILLLGTAIALPFIFEKKIVALVKKAVNDQIEANFDFGDYDLSLIRSFPNFSLRLDSITLDGKNEFENIALAEINRLELTIDLMSVFKGDEIKVLRFKLLEPNLNLLILENGKANWDIVKQDSLSATRPEEETAPIKLTRLKAYQIENGQLNYEDLEGSMMVKMKGLNHTGSGDFSQDIFTLITKTSLNQFSLKQGGVNYLSNAKLEADVSLEADINNFRFTFKENSATLNDLSIHLNGFVAMPEEAIDMDLNLIADRFSFKSMLSLIPAIYRADFNSLQASGQAELAGFIKGRYDAATNQMPGFDFKAKVINGNFKFPEQPVGVEKVYLDLSVKSEGKDQYDDLKLDLSKGSFEIDGQGLQFELSLRNPISDPLINLTGNGVLDLEKLSKAIPPEPGTSYTGVIALDISLNGRMSDIEQQRYERFAAAGNFSISNLIYQSPDFKEKVQIQKMDGNVTPAKLDINEFDMQYGKSDLRAKGQLNNYLNYIFKDEPIAGNFTVSSNYLNLNDLKQEFSGETDTTTGTEEGVIVLPGNIDFQLTATAKEIVYDNLNLTDVSGKVGLRNQQAFLQNLSMNVMDGQLVINGNYDSRVPEKPAVNFDMSIKNWDIQSSARNFVTIEKLAPIARRCTGRFSTNLNFSTVLLKDMRPDLTAVQAKGNLFTRSVYIEGFEPLNELAAKLNIARLAKQTINDLAMYFEVADGRFNVNPYEVKLGNSKAVLAGFTNLSQELFYKINLDIPRSEFGSTANQWIDDLAAKARSIGIKADPLQMVKLDITVDGTITVPRFQIKWSEQSGNPLQNLKNELESQLRAKAEEVKSLVEDKAREVKEETEQKIRESAEEVRVKAQEELNRRADQVVAEAERQATRIRQEAKTLAESVRREAAVNAQKLEDEAFNPIQKAAAKAAADRIRREAGTRASQIENEANQRADRLQSEARAQADRIRKGEEG